MEANEAPPAEMTIGELAKRVGKTPRALRLYEQMGLIRPSGRSGGGFRHYGPDALVRLRWITRLVDLGMPLNEVGHFLEAVQARPDGDGAMQQTSSFFTEKLSDVEAQIARLQSLRAALIDAIEFASACRGCFRTGIPEACRNCSRHDGAPLPDLVEGLFAQTDRDPPAAEGTAQ